MVARKTTKSSANSFGTFLQTAQKSSNLSKKEPDLAILILGLLGKGPDDLSNVISAFDVGPTEIMNALRDMEFSGFVEITKEDGGGSERRVSITSSGEGLYQKLAAP